MKFTSVLYQRCFDLNKPWDREIRLMFCNLIRVFNDTFKLIKKYHLLYLSPNNIISFSDFVVDAMKFLTEIHTVSEWLLLMMPEMDYKKIYINNNRTIDFDAEQKIAEIKKILTYYTSSTFCGDIYDYVQHDKISIQLQKYAMM